MVEEGFAMSTIRERLTSLPTLIIGGSTFAYLMVSAAMKPSTPITPTATPDKKTATPTAEKKKEPDWNGSTIRICKLFETSPYVKKCRFKYPRTIAVSLAVPLTGDGGFCSSIDDLIRTRGPFPLGPDWSLQVFYPISDRVPFVECDLPP
jgi:hypothetical protein